MTKEKDLNKRIKELENRVDIIEEAYQQGRMQGWKDNESLMINLKEELKEYVRLKCVYPPFDLIKFIDKAFEKHIGEGK